MLIAHLDADARINWQSHFLEPYSSDRILGKRPWEFHDQENASMFKAAFAAVVTEHQEEAVTLRISHIGMWRIDLYPCHQREVRVVCVCRHAPPKLDKLTARHKAICRLLASGEGTKEIASILDLSRGTIDNYKTEISSRLGIKSRALPAWCGANALWF